MADVGTTAATTLPDGHRGCVPRLLSEPMWVQRLVGPG
jgi:hypothetical protein